MIRVPPGWASVTGLYLVLNSASASEPPAPADAEAPALAPLDSPGELDSPPELAAGWDAAALLGEGLVEAPLHAANTTIVVASKLKMRFRIKAPPDTCVSPHTGRIGRRIAAGIEPSASPARVHPLGRSVNGTHQRTVSGRLLRCRYYGQRVKTLSNRPRQP